MYFHKKSPVNPTFKRAPYLLLLVFFLANPCISKRDDRNYCSSSSDRKKELSYHKKQFLGKGGFGKVYGDGYYAIKEMEVKSRGNQKDLTNHELAGMLGFDDLNVVKTVPQGCYVKNNYSSYTVWVKLIQYDSDLDKLVHKHYKKVQEDIWKLDIMFKIASALKKFHDHNMCHFDLKEQNIFTLNDFTPVLGDLGMLHTVQMAKQIGFSGGTPLYLGKKVMDGKESVAIDECKADIYALGVVFYQIIRGKASNYINDGTIAYEKGTSTNRLFQDMATLLEAMLIETQGIYYDQFQGKTIKLERPSINTVLLYLAKLI